MPQINVTLPPWLRGADDPSDYLGIPTTHPHPDDCLACGDYIVYIAGDGTYEGSALVVVDARRRFPRRFAALREHRRAALRAKREGGEAGGTKSGASR